MATKPTTKSGYTDVTLSVLLALAAFIEKEDDELLDSPLITTHELAMPRILASSLARTHTYSHMHTHACMCAHTQVRAHTRAHTHTHARTRMQIISYVDEEAHQLCKLGAV